MGSRFWITVGTVMMIAGFFLGFNWTDQLLVVLKGISSIVLIGLGAFIVWLEAGDTSTEKEKERVQSKLKQEATRGSQASGNGESREQSQDRVKCPVCGKEFDTERGMKIHKAQKHGE